MDFEFVDVAIKPPPVSTSAKSAGALLAHNGPVTCLAVDVTGTLLVSGGTDGMVKLWNTTAKALLTSLDGVGGPVRVWLCVCVLLRVVGGGSVQRLTVCSVCKHDHVNRIIFWSKSPNYKCY